MSFNLNYFKGATLNQAQHALQYWMNALRPAEEVDKLKEEKEREITSNVSIAVEGQDDDKKEEVGPVGANELIYPPCFPQSYPPLYE